MIQGIEEVPAFQFYLHKSGEIYWIGSSSGEFAGYSWTSAMIDWDRQDEYKNLAWDTFTIPIATYLHKQGYYDIVMYELLRTNHGMYLCDLNARVSGDTAHLLVAPFMAQLGYKQSWVIVHKKINAPPKIIVENAEDINKAANNGRVVVLSAAGDDLRNYKIKLRFRCLRSLEIVVVVVVVAKEIDDKRAKEIDDKRVFRRFAGEGFINEMKTDGEYTEQMFGKNQTPRAGFEPGHDNNNNNNIVVVV
ncbi:hypothetical protein QZH41_004840 [Actinostola sp. cb2023]|nr:hypothetical protein QZH41_004840 [Actinostola sp. cb2023]